jgi:Tol biopolymer transport system component/DNA-binding winged helix-turn-helix (wHTH) protein
VALPLDEITAPTHVVRFGVFEVDLHTGELRKQGLKIKLQEQPFQVLAMLLERPGEVVTREEIQQKLWPEDTFVDFEHSINAAVKRLREALDDSADNPRFVETLHRRGYRFIAPVDVGAGLAPPSGAAVGAVREPPLRKRRVVAATGGVVVAIAAAILGYRLTRPLPPPKVLRTVQLTRDRRPKYPIMVTDGVRLYFSEIIAGSWTPVAVPTSGGEVVQIPSPLRDAVVQDISPDGSELLVMDTSTIIPEGPLWIIRVFGGAARRVGDAQCGEAAWAPDGREILCLRGNDLFLTNVDGGESRKLATAPGFPYFSRWSPDGNRISISVYDGKSRALWELARDGTNFHQKLPGWNAPLGACSGHWTPDGKYFLFDSDRGGTIDVWVMAESRSFFQRRSLEPIQLTVMAVDSGKPVPSKDGKKIFVLAAETYGELQRYDGQAHHFVPYLSGISAEGTDFSRDGRWVTYVSVPEGTLWRSNVDGRERLQLTSPPMHVFLPRWSPDAKRIAFQGQVPGKAWRIYVLPAEGGSPQELLPGKGKDQFDVGWSADGQTIVFSESMSPDSKIYLLDLQANKVSTLPGSEGLYSPRWSPDGRYIAALRSSEYYLWLFDLRVKRWIELLRIPVGYPTWSHDSKYIYFDSPKGPAFYRLRVRDRKLEQVFSLEHVPLTGNLGGWTGLAPDDSPLVLRNVGVNEVYALDWEAP